MGASGPGSGPAESRLHRIAGRARASGWLSRKRLVGATAVFVALNVAVIAGVASVGSASPRGTQCGFSGYSGGGGCQPPVLIVTVESPATLVARGAAVNVPVKVECNAQFAELNIQVTERVGSAIAQGYGYTSVGCTGSTQTLIVNVPANSTNSFKRGYGQAQAHLFGCLAGCADQTDTEIIKIVKAAH